MTEIDPHQAFLEAHAFVSRYLDQLSRLLGDGREELERRGYRMLRNDGNRYVANVDTIMMEPWNWIATWVFAFFAPAAAFEGRSYGVPAHAVERVLFLAGALGDLPDCPAIWMGWLEGFDREGNLETKLRSFYATIDPQRLIPEPQPLTALGASPIQVASVPDSELKIGLARVPMRLLSGRKDMIALIENLLNHVKP